MTTCLFSILCPRARRGLQQRSPPVEEVAMEGPDLEPAAAADAHHCLPGSGPREVARQLSRQLGSVTHLAEARVVVHLRSGSGIILLDNEMTCIFFITKFNGLYLVLFGRVTHLVEARAVVHLHSGSLYVASIL
jgi:hypothetical protein